MKRSGEHLLFDLYGILADDQEISLRDFRISFPQMKLLSALRVSNSRTVGELGRETGASLPAATTMVTRLAREGLVERREDRRDKRKVRVFLTLRGRRKIDRLHAQRRRRWERLLGRLPRSEQTRLIRAVEDAVALLKKAAAVAVKQEKGR